MLKKLAYRLPLECRPSTPKTARSTALDTTQKKPDGILSRRAASF
jgi:hypothetical protein